MEIIEQLDHINSIVTPGLYILVVTTMILEGVILMLMKRHVNHYGGVISGISGGLAFGAIFLANKALFFGLIYKAYDFRLFELGFKWYIWVIAILLFDFMFYVVHRLGHEIRFFWCMHSVHHTSEEMRLTSGIRGSMFDFIYLPLFVIWIPLLGFHPLMIFIVETFTRLYGVYTHISEHFVGKQPFLERIFITPSAHRVHHGRNHQYLDRNYAEVFSFWDKLFGTWQSEEEKPEYGVLKSIDTDNLKQIQFREFRDLWIDIQSADRFIDKLKYVIMPPGWKHTGDGITSKMLRAKTLQKNVAP